MYCGACLHDNTLAAAMLQLGADVLFVPTYTPIRTDEADVSQKRVLFGGIERLSAREAAAVPLHALVCRQAV